MSSAETPSNNKRISLSNSFSDDQGYHGSGAEHEGEDLVAWLPKVVFLLSLKSMGREPESRK